MIRFYYTISIMHIMSEREMTSLVERLLHTKPFDYNYHNLGMVFKVVRRWLNDVLMRCYLVA